MQLKQAFLVSIVLLLSASVSAIELKTQQGEYSQIQPILIEKCNYIIRDNLKETYPDGIVIYFLVYPQNTSSKQPTIKELRDFNLNGNSYKNITKSRSDVVIEPNSVFYDTSTFFNYEPSMKQKIKFSNSKKGIIMKTTICGDTLPKSGIITLQVDFGWDKQLENFTFEFNLDSL